MLTYKDLINEMKKFTPVVDEEFIKNAYIFALDKHGTQTRESGEIFFSHPLEVAQILIELKMDQVTVAAGLLHDTVEDTDTTLSEIKDKFGEEVSKIVDGVTKLSKIETINLKNKRCENYKKLLIYAASDIRVLIIKLADRLHNMRTLKYKKKKNKRIEIAKETLQIYAPLAERIGLNKLKDELQDIAFYEMYPNLYNSIRSKLKELFTSSEELINVIMEKLDVLIKQLNINYSITGRLKSPYSIWNKMNVRTISFDQLSDIIAFRIIVDNNTQCYKVLQLIHKNYSAIPGRFRDYISAPKNNQYQSLHTCIIGPLNKRMEIQIRTHEMHVVAEYGIAAHWEYKEGSGSSSKTHNDYQWLKNMVKIFEETSNMDDFIKYSSTEISPESVFGITPQGTIIQLPLGSSVLDFAYAIHTYVGNHAIKAIVNKKEVPLSNIFDNGSQIEIITDKKMYPDSRWLTFVKTIKAKTAIRKAVTNLEIDKNLLSGKNNFDQLFKSNNIVIQEKELNKLLKLFKLSTINQLYIALGNKAILLPEVVEKYNTIGEKKLSMNLSIGDKDGLLKGKVQEAILGLPRNVKILHTECCSPVPGDKIYGIWYYKNDNSIEIHNEDCQKFIMKSSNFDVKILDLYWDGRFDFCNQKYISKLLICIRKSNDVLQKISSILKDKKTVITNIKTNDTLNNSSEVFIEFYVDTISQLNIIINALLEQDFVISIKRV